MKEDNKVLRSDSMSNHRIPLNIQLFADGDGDGDGDGNVQTEAVKFGNVEFSKEEMAGLSEDMRSKMGLINKSYVASRQQVTDLGVTNKTLADQNAGFKKTIETKPANSGLSPEMKIVMDKLSSLEGRISGDAINSHEVQSKALLTTKYGDENATKIIKEARLEFDKVFTDPSQRTPEIFDLYVNQRIAGLTDTMLKGRYDITDSKAFVQMMEDPNFKTQAEKYAKDLGQDGIEFLIGSNNTMEDPIQGEELQDKLKDMTRPERIKFMIEQAQKDQIRRGKRNFVK